MKIEAKGIIVKKIAKKYQKKDGTNGFSADVAIKVGEFNGYEQIECFSTNKDEHIEFLKSIKDGERIEVVGYTGGSFGTSKTTGKDYIIAKNTISEIKRQDENIDTNPVIVDNNEEVNADDDLPF